MHLHFTFSSRLIPRGPHTDVTATHCVLLTSSTHTATACPSAPCVNSSTPQTPLTTGNKLSACRESSVDVHPRDCRAWSTSIHAPCPRAPPPCAGVVLHYYALRTTVLLTPWGVLTRDVCSEGACAQVKSSQVKSSHATSAPRGRVLRSSFLHDSYATHEIAHDGPYLQHVSQHTHTAQRSSGESARHAVDAMRWGLGSACHCV
jgi:hypothetical protein